MIEKFDAFHDTQNGVDNQQLTRCFMSARALVKLNDLVDAVNALVEENNIHEKQIDELQMKLRPILEERKSQIKVYEETMEMVKKNKGE